MKDSCSAVHSFVYVHTSIKTKELDQWQDLLVVYSVKTQELNNAI